MSTARNLHKLLPVAYLCQDVTQSYVLNRRVASNVSTSEELSPTTPLHSSAKPSTQGPHHLFVETFVEARLAYMVQFYEQTCELMFLD
uniref:Uncharacterized protein n=1 Tax=Romanomermis culicivorax TaxID=13658 RepID=A0A915JRS5_ROMCU